MSLDQLIATMQARGADEIAEILEEARVQALSMAQAALDAMTRQREDLVHQQQRAWESEANATVAEARRKAAAQVLEARAAALERVWRRAYDLLSQDDVIPRLRSAVPNHVNEALPYLDGKDVVVRCSAKLADAVRTTTQSADRILAVEIDEDVRTGVMVAAIDGSVAIDNTLQARLARLRPTLATEITARLTALASPNGNESGHAGLE